MTESGFCFFLCCGAFGTSQGSYACHCASRFCSYFALVPIVGGFRVGFVTTRAFLPMLTFVVLPRSAFKVVTERIDRFRFGFGAYRTGKGFHTRLCTSGSCGLFAVVPFMAVHVLRGIGVECGLVFPCNGAHVFSVTECLGIECFVGLTFQCGVYHVARHGSGKSEIHIIRVTPRVRFSGNFQRILAILQSGESISIACSCD